MAKEFIYTMQDLRKVASGKEILKGIHLSFFPGAKIGVIGPNGAGKSTLLRIMAGVDTEFLGTARKDADATVGYVPQEPQLDASLDVRGNLALGLAPIRALLDAYEAISAQFAEPMDDDTMNALLEKQGILQEQIDACNGWEIDRMLEVASDALRLPPADADVTTLSGGERRRVALAQVLLRKPDLLLLDEPTNHLDADSVAWLEQHLKAYTGTVVSITHDRYFLDNVAQWILELDRGEGVPYKGNYAAWLEQKGQRLAVEERTESARQRMLKRELEWVRSSAKARQAKGKARLARFEAAQNQAQNDKEASGEIFIPPGPELQGLVLQVEGLTKAFGERLLIKDLSFRLPKGGIVGIVGANGAGKSTLFRMLTQEVPCDAGLIRWGDNVKLAYVDQSRDALNDDRSVFEEITEGAEVVELGPRQINARGYVANFAFKGTDQQKKVRYLSGGERNRVHLAKMLRVGGNVLLLDEPTNDLDVETLRSLEEGLLNFPGCAVVITHDRWFLNRVATHILAFEGDSYVHFFDGNFQDYEEDRAKRLGTQAGVPTRVRYRPLTVGGA
jgi:sulfate-transporting ATPase